MRKYLYQLVPYQKCVLTKKQYFSNNLWSTINYFLIHGSVSNDSGGYLYAPSSKSYVIYSTSIKTAIYRIIGKGKRGGNGGSDKKVSSHK